MNNISEREVPGFAPVEWREYRYVSDDGSKKFIGRKGLFHRIFDAAPGIVEGGVTTENCNIWLPTGELFHGLSYKGDIPGWRGQVEQGAAQLGLLVAQIVGGKFIVSDGRQYDLSDCKVEFY